MDALLPVPAAEYLSAALADAALKSALLLAVAALVAGALRSRSAALRHRVWTLALAGALALPVFALVLPAWHVPLPTPWPAGEEEEAAPAAAAPVSNALPLYAPAAGPRAEAAFPAPRFSPAERPAASAAPLPEPSAGAAGAEAWRSAPRPLGSGGGLIATAPHERAPLVEAQAPIANGVDAPDEAGAAHGGLRWLLLAWAGGASLVFAYFFAGTLWAERLVQQARPVADARWEALAAEAAQQLGLGRRVRLAYTAHAAAPMVWGLFGPAVVLLPEAAAGWDEPQRRAVLLHEMAHLQRRDCATQLIGQVACALYWFNPLAWWAAHQMRVERERACDDHVLQGRFPAPAYAEHLVSVARTLRRAARPPAGALTMARPSNLEDRVARILNPSVRRGALGPRAAKGLAAAAVGLVGLLAAVQPPLGTAEAAERSAAFEERAPGTDTLRTNGREVRWSGALPEGATLEVKNISGPIRAEAARGDEAEVVVRRGGEDWRAVEVRQVERPDGGVTLCALFPDRDGASEERSCEPGQNGRLGGNGGTDAQAAFVVRVPEGVRFDASTISGSVQAAGLPADAQARTVSGNISLAAAGHASGQTVSGNVEVEMGRTDWSGALALETVSGNLTVVLPAGADADVEAETMNGEIASAFSLEAEEGRFVGARAEGTLGDGGRALRLKTVSGNVRLRSASGNTGEVFRYRRTGLGGLGLTPPPAFVMPDVQAPPSPPLPPNGPRVFFRTDTSLSEARERLAERSQRLAALRRELAENPDGPELRARIETAERRIREAERRLEEAKHRSLLRGLSPVATDSSMEEWEAYWDEHADGWARYGEAVGRQAEEWAERWSEEWGENWAEAWSDGNAHGFVFGTDDHGHPHQSDSLRQQLRALKALSRLPDEESVPRLIEIARTHESERIRAEAVEALARKDAPAAARFFEEVLRDANAPARVQEEALQALYRQRGAESIPVLIEVARTSPHPEVRDEAIEYLGRSGDPRAADALADLVRAQ